MSGSTADFATAGYGPTQIVLEAIREAPSQPRKTYGPMEDLVDSIKRLGVLQPILVRPCEATPTSPAVFEVVFGHRRLRAAREAGLAQIPATIRELRDLEVLEAQLVENCHRVDVHPLEEAEAYETLKDRHGFPVEEIAAKVGRSVSYVRQRMRLTALGKAGREAFYAGSLTPATALLVARIPDATLQAKAVHAAKGALHQLAGDGEPMTTNELRDYIADELMVAMKAAPWALEDTELVPPAGPCTTCPKRTGNEPELFADLEKHDHCTDPPCYRSKLAAWGQRRLAEAKTAGRRVLTAKETKGVFAGAAASHGVVYVNAASGWQSLDDKDYIDSKMRTLRQLIGKVAEPVIALAPTGQVVELVERKKVSALMKKAGHAPKSKGEQRSGSSAEEKQRLAEMRLERSIAAQAERRIWEAAVATVEGASLAANPTLLLAELRLLALAAIDDRLLFDATIAGRAAVRRGLEADEDSLPSDNVLGSYLKTWVRSAQDPEQILALLIECFFWLQDTEGDGTVELELREEALVTLGISETAITEAVRQEIKTRAEQVSEPAPATTKAKKKAATKGGE